MDSWTTLASGSTSITLQPGDGKRPPDPPKGLIVTQAVQLQDGWVGQILVDKDIVWQSPAPWPDGEKAQAEANQRVIERVKTLLS